MKTWEIGDSARLKIDVRAHNMLNYPIYILDLDKPTVVFPEGKEDIGHCDFWERAVCHKVADHFKVSAKRLKNLPYCQRRARIVEGRIYYGEKDGNNELLQLIRLTVGDDTLVFYHDHHERRLKDDVRRFRRLTKGNQ